MAEVLEAGAARRTLERRAGADGVRPTRIRQRARVPVVARPLPGQEHAGVRVRDAQVVRAGVVVGAGAPTWLTHAAAARVALGAAHPVALVRDPVADDLELAAALDAHHLDAARRRLSAVAVLEATARRRVVAPEERSGADAQIQRARVTVLTVERAPGRAFPCPVARAIRRARVPVVAGVPCVQLYRDAGPGLRRTARDPAGSISIGVTRRRHRARVELTDALLVARDVTEAEVLGSQELLVAVIGVRRIAVGADARARRAQRDPSGAVIVNRTRVAVLTRCGRAGRHVHAPPIGRAAVVRTRIPVSAAHRRPEAGREPVAHIALRAVIAVVARGPERRGHQITASALQIPGQARVDRRPASLGRRSRRVRAHVRGARVRLDRGRRVRATREDRDDEE